MLQYTYMSTWHVWHACHSKQSQLTRHIQRSTLLFFIDDVYSALYTPPRETPPTTNATSDPHDHATKPPPLLACSRVLPCAHRDSSRNLRIDDFGRGD